MCQRIPPRLGCLETARPHPLAVPPLPASLSGLLTPATFSSLAPGGPLRGPPLQACPLRSAPPDFLRGRDSQVMGRCGSGVTKAQSARPKGNPAYRSPVEWCTGSQITGSVAPLFQQVDLGCAGRGHASVSYCVLPGWFTSAGGCGLPSGEDPCTRDRASLVGYPQRGALDSTMLAVASSYARGQ
jgi:hypothetical protein